MTDADASVVCALDLRKEYGKDEGLIRAVDGVDLDVERGETLAVMGPSGCGKSTLLHLLGGLDRPSQGELWLNGRRIDQLSERGLARMRRGEVGFVFSGVPPDGRIDRRGERGAAGPAGRPLPPRGPPTRP
jgi:ABC-type lipoprotein export system ATPase subunit